MPASRPNRALAFAVVAGAGAAGVERFLADGGRYPLERAIWLWGRAARPWVAPR